MSRQWIGGWRLSLAAVCMLLGVSPLASAQVSLGVGVAVPGLRIGIDIPAYPQFSPIPGYPVYYAPGLNANLFFYDGLYWLLGGDDWYYSSWYNGPWYRAEPELVPDFILRVPVLYYRRPPAYFFGWDRLAPPRWGDHWGPAWRLHRGDWERWDHRLVPPRAPLPTYQSRYPRSRYPGTDRQRTLEMSNYHYRPREPGDRSRLQQPPSRTVPRQSRPGAPPTIQAAPPRATRPPALTRPLPAPRAERGAPGESPQNRRSGGQPPRQQGDSGQRRDDGQRDRRARDRPPG